MSMRARAGALQALTHPGARVALSSLSTSSAVVSGFSSGQKNRSAVLSPLGAQLEYQRA